MKLSKKFLSLGLATALVLGCSIYPSAYELPKLDKIEGANNYETAALVADRQNYSSAILVNLDTSIADGLSSSGLSGATNSPILLTKKDSVPDVSMTRLNKAKKVYIIGGVNSVSSEVENSLKSKGKEVIRISGIDRIETSLNVAKEVKRNSNSKYVYYANAYKGEPDAISIASVAARDNGVIILTNGNNTSYRENGSENYVIGGKATMSDNIVKSTNSYRIGGLDRFDTNAKIIEWFYHEAPEGTPTPEVPTFHVADGYNLASGLITAPIAKYAPLVIVAEKSNKSILSGAGHIISVGKLSNSVINECLDPFPVISDMFGSWFREDEEGLIMNLDTEEFGYLIGGEYDYSNYTVVSYDRKNNSVIIKLHSDDFAPYMRFTLMGNGKLKHEFTENLGGRYILVGYYY